MSKKTDLIEAVQDAAKQWDNLASCHSIEAARFPGNEQGVADARKAVACMDTAHKIRDKIVELIHIHWPK